MAQETIFSELKAAIQKSIKSNGNKEISGQVLQSTLLSIINNTNSLALFAGIASPDTNPVMYGGNYFYIAHKAGNYVNFKTVNGGYISVDNNSIYIIYKQFDNDYWAIASIVDFINYKLSSAQDCLAKIIEAEGALRQEIISDSTIYYRLNNLSGEIYAIVKFTNETDTVRLSVSSEESGTTITKDILYDYRAEKNDSIIFSFDANVNNYIRLSTTGSNEAIQNVNIKLYSLKAFLTEESDLIKGIVKDIETLISIMPSSTYAEFTDYTKIYNKRIEAGVIMAASTGYITSYIPIDKSKKYLLTTSVNEYNSGISYYTTNSESGFISSDIINKLSGMTVTDYMLNIPDNAKYMIASCSEVTSNFNIKTSGGLEKLSNIFLTEESDLIKGIVKDIETLISIMPSSTYAEFTDYTKIYNKRIEAGVIMAASTGYITSYIPIDKSKKYLLTTSVNEYNSGISYYTTNSESGFISSDIINKLSGMTVTDYMLNIPDNAKYMIASCSEVTSNFNIKTSGGLEKLSNIFLTEESDLIKGIVKDIETTQPEKINAIEKNVASIQKAIEENREVYTSSCVREKRNATLYLGPNLLTDLANSTYSQGWSIVDSRLVYDKSKGTSSFSFNIETTKNLRYFAKLKISTADNAYENLFFLKIGNSELLDVYTGSNEVSGGLLSDGGKFTIVPTGQKSFTIDEVQLYAIVSHDNHEYVETKEVLNVNSGNADATSIDAKWNVAIGPSEETMANVVNGSRSIAIGINALKYWQYGLQNIAIGTYALHNLISGTRNIAIGSDCFWQTEYANDTIAIGKQALEATKKNLKLNYNVCIGNSAGYSNTKDGTYSVVIGYNACKNVGTNNVCIGANSEASGDNSIVIGANANASDDDSIVIGTNQSSVRIGGKLIKFNSDKSVTWE